MDATRRFSDRVEDYVLSRPGYPAGVIETMERECGLCPSSTVADIGSGTGIFSALLLTRGCRVIGVEPNREMRRAAERALGNRPRFRSVSGTAESTMLEDRSVHLITSAQAFHWFDQSRARREFLRILRPDGWVVLVWNERDTLSTPFLRAYEDLLIRFAIDYSSVDHRWAHRSSLEEFFAPSRVSTCTFPNRQVFDFPGLRGRLLSASYVPATGQIHHRQMLERLSKLFEEFSVDGTVTMEYSTIMHWGKLEEPR